MDRNRKALLRRLSRDGLPLDAREWTEEDWRDLHEAIETAKRKIAARHARPCAGGRTPPTTPTE